MARSASVSWVRSTWLVLLALVSFACQGKIGGGDIALQAQASGSSGGANVAVTPSATCPLGQTECSGRCVDTSADAANCGACAKACGAGDVCEQGACHELCAQGETLCGSTCVSMQSDPNHCGACGTVCAAGQYCSDGVCGAACAHQLCQSATGVQCVDTNTHPDN